MRSLYPPQKDVLDGGYLDLGWNCLLNLPTGAGKTLLAELAMDQALARGATAAYLSPLRAIADEKVVAWRHRWPDHQVGIYTGDYATLPVNYDQAQILVATFERFDACLRQWQQHLHWIAKLGVLIIDEIHLLMDASRGGRLEGLISRLRRVNPLCQIVGLSGTLSNHAQLAAWLGGVSYASTWRPVPLVHERVGWKKLADKEPKIVDLVQRCHAGGGQSLVFVNSRRRAERLARTLVEAGLVAAHHHAGLSPAVRAAIEGDFRAGHMAALVATPTLEAGVNLPARQVIIADPSRFEVDGFRPIPVWTYLQRAGRAGRPGLDGAGTCIVLAPSWAKDLPAYGRAHPEPVTSTLCDAAQMAEQIVVEIASRTCRTLGQLRTEFLPSTLAWHQDQERTQRVFELAVADMGAAGLICAEAGILRASPAGRVAARRQIAPATALAIVALADLPDPTDVDILLSLAWTGACGRAMVDLESVDALEDGIARLPSRLLDAPPPQHLAPRQVVAGVLVAWILAARMQGVEADTLARQIDCYQQDVEQIIEAGSRLLQTAAELHHAIDAERCPGGAEAGRRIDARFGPRLTTRLARLACQVTHGLPADAAQLTLVDGIGGTLARRLNAAGIGDLEQLAQCEASTLAEIPGVGPQRAATWPAAAAARLPELDGWHPPAVPQVDRLRTPLDWPAGVDAGRLMRATALTVTRAGHDWIVAGGADEHRIASGACDCADAANRPGLPCKHLLAIRLTQGDPVLTGLLERARERAQVPSIAGHLADLIMGRRAREAA